MTIPLRRSSLDSLCHYWSSFWS